MRRFLATSMLCLAILAPSTAFGAFVTTHETEIEAIYAGVGGGIDVRYGPTTFLNDPSYLTLSSEAKVLALLDLPAPASPTINLFFVDTLSWCGVADPGFYGCATTPGHNVFVESVFTASALGDELVAHEIGHNLGLGHVSDPARLMDPSIAGGTTLTASEITTILSSPLIQNDGVDFIYINPILVTPEPGTFALLSLGIVGLIAQRRRVRARS